ncbi:MAG: HEAT repeat domain-containing protein, partial [Chloroflexi bacterium]|nr:HEAT repeat domain-containing protein [Chloroflexota bacterium]
LYDTDVDPHQIHNLAASLAHHATLAKMRRVLREWLLESRDAGFLTEPQMWERLRAGGTPFEIAADANRYPLARLLDAAELVGRADAVPEQMKLLRDPDDGVRYWAAVGLHSAGQGAASAREPRRQALQDASAVVRIEAAAALAELGDTRDSLPVLEMALRSPEPEVVLHAARALELMGDRARPLLPAIREVLARVRQNEQNGGDMLLFIGFSLESAKEQLTAEPWERAVRP